MSFLQSHQTCEMFPRSLMVPSETIPQTSWKAVQPDATSRSRVTTIGLVMRAHIWPWRPLLSLGYSRPCCPSAAVTMVGFYMWTVAIFNLASDGVDCFTCSYEKLSYRRETALQGVLVLAKSGRMGLRDDILRTLYVYLQPLWHNRPARLSSWLEKKQSKGYYAVQGHRGRYQSKAHMRLAVSD